MNRRIALLVAALVVALAGTTMIITYFGGRSAATAQEPTAAVLVARAAIPAGTTGQQVLDQGLAELTPLPARAVVPGSLTDLSAVSTRVSTTDVQPGEQLLQVRFADPNVAGALTVPDDKIAMSVDVQTDAQRVGQFVKPGSEVAVFDTYEVSLPPDAPQPPGQPEWPEGAARPVVSKATRLMLPRVTVLAVGTTAQTPAPGQPDQAAAAGQAAPSTTVVTLAVTVEEAQKLAHAAQTGQITLGLLSDRSRTGTAGPDDTRTLF